MYRKDQMRRDIRIVASKRAGKQSAAGMGVVFLFCCFAWATSDTEEVQTMVAQSRFDSVCAAAKTAYAADSADAGNALAYAQSLGNGMQARDIYKKIVARKSAPDSIRAEAYFRLACIAYMAANYGKAAAYCDHAGKLSDNPRYALLCGRSAVRARGDSAVKVSAALAPPNRSADSGKELKSRADDGSPRALAVDRYYVQVGAFAAIENAQGLKTELSRRFSKVSITAGTSGGKKVFRVRVGAFSGKETAQAFGDSVLVKKGMQFRVVEE